VSSDVLHGYGDSKNGTEEVKLMVNWAWVITSGLLCGTVGLTLGFFVSMHFVGKVVREANAVKAKNTTTTIQKAER